MSATRAIAWALALILGVPVIGVALLYAYRAQAPAPGGPIGAAPLFGFGIVAALLSIAVPVVILFLVVYAAVRLAIQHERRTARPAPSESGTNDDRSRA